jgi:hypothetical protein
MNERGRGQGHGGHCSAQPPPYSLDDLHLMDSFAVIYVGGCLPVATVRDVTRAAVPAT